MKKRFTLLCSALLLLALLAGCGQTNDPASQPSGESTPPATSETESQTVPQQTPPTETAPPPAATAPEDCSLKELFAAHDMKVGTCLTPQMISNAKSSQLILSQFNSITMENSMKPDYIFNKKESIATGDLVVEFNKDAIKMLNWAKANDIAVRGHTLVWYSQTPNWIFYEDFDTGKNMVGRDVMLSRMESFIKQVFDYLNAEGYSDIIYAYDVVNEAWMEDGKMRQNNWTATVGDDYLWYAFYFADKYAPESIDLYYNDYNEQFKYDTFVDFVNTLVDDDGNYLIDGVGFQAHLYTEDDLDLYFDAVDAIGATGLKLELTELDVCLGKYQSPKPATEENLQTQGQFYYNLINGLFERADAGAIRMDALTFWGFADNLSWRKEYSPLLYDKTYTPKYAYYGAMQLKEFAGF